MQVQDVHGTYTKRTNGNTYSEKTEAMPDIWAGNFFTNSDMTHVYKKQLGCKKSDFK